ncbi:MAG: SH3 domain-containing protein [Candidatus Riflebacteria bacterium]|nr:SH3 domain-containing protein [Candidatus Riflebacteria bacterium]
MKRSTGLYLKIIVVALLVSIAFPVFAKNRVIPTWYGYGVMPSSNSWTKPYIVNVTGVPFNYSYYYPAYYLPTQVVYSPLPVYNYPGYWHVGVVKSSALNVRSEPYVKKGNSTSNVVAGLAVGEKVWVIGRAGDWYYVQSASGKQVWGYVHSSYLDVTPYQGAAGVVAASVAAPVAPVYYGYYGYNGYGYYGYYGYPR